jgi:hypothetical protein
MKTARGIGLGGEANHEAAVGFPASLLLRGPGLSLGGRDIRLLLYVDAVAHKPTVSSGRSTCQFMGQCEIWVGCERQFSRLFSLRRAPALAPALFH